MTSPLDLPGLTGTEVNATSPPTPYPTSELNFPSIKSQDGSPRPPSIPRPEGPLLLRQRMQSVLYRTNMKRKEMRARKSLMASVTMANSLRHDEAKVMSKALRDVNARAVTQEGAKLRPRSHQVTDYDEVALSSALIFNFYYKLASLNQAKIAVLTFQCQEMTGMRNKLSSHMKYLDRRLRCGLLSAGWANKINSIIFHILA